MVARSVTGTTVPSGKATKMETMAPGAKPLPTKETSPPLRVPSERVTRWVMVGEWDQVSGQPARCSARRPRIDTPSSARKERGSIENECSVCACANLRIRSPAPCGCTAVCSHTRRRARSAAATTCVELPGEVAAERARHVGVDVASMPWSTYTCNPCPGCACTMPVCDLSCLLAV